MKKIIPSILLAVSAGSSLLLAQTTTNYNNQVTGCRLQVTGSNQTTENQMRQQAEPTANYDNLGQDLSCHLMIDPVELKNIEEGIEDVKGAFGSPVEIVATTFSPAESSSFSSSSSRMSAKGLNAAITAENVITDSLLDRTYLCSYGTSGVKIYIESQQLWIEQENGESRALNPWEIKNFNEVAAYLSQSRAETMLPDICYARVIQTNINEYSVSLNFRMLGGGTCMSVPEPEMIIAAKTGDRATISRLLTAGVDVNSRGNYGTSALQYAAQHGHLQIVQDLIAAGADVNSRDNRGISVLMLAIACSNSAAIVEILLNAGADIHAVANNGLVALDAACGKTFDRRAYPDIACVLLKYGADIHRIGGTPKRPPLGTAVCYGHPAIVKILLEAGASPYQKDGQGKVANQYICEDYNGPDKAGVIRSITSLLNNPPVAVDYAGIAAAKRAVETRENAEAEAKRALEQRIRSNQAQYEQTLFKIARSVIRQLFEDGLNPERQEMVQSTVHNFLKSSLLLKDSGVDLPDDASHTARRAGLTTALVSELKPKKYLWGSTDFDAGEIQDELKNIILIWSSKIKEEVLEKSRLERIEDRLATIGNNAALSRSQAPVQNASMTEDAARAAAKGAAQEIGSRAARAALGALF